MAVDEQRWEPESPFTELEEGEQLLGPEMGFGEEELARPLVTRALATPAAAQGLGSVYVKITGRTHGDFPGDSTAHGHQGWLVGTGFDYQLTVPRDVATGQASGKRQHGPVTLTLPWAAASPLLFQAAVSNETLTKVVFEFPAVGRDGTELVAQRVTLTDAHMTAYHRSADERRVPPEFDQISFTFRQITIEDLGGRTTGQDDWSSAKEVGETESWESETYELDGAGVRRSGADGFA